MDDGPLLLPSLRSDVTGGFGNKPEPAGV